jgi:ectoine hydroxylase-related dioxygenase (phytanoyl-CoA dioxygenase family)
MCNVKLKISLVRFIGMENAKEKLESLTCEELVRRLSRSARVAILYDKSYDVVDEMARYSNDATKVAEYFSKISRIILKTYNDFCQNSNDSHVCKRLLAWERYLEEFEMRCLNEKEKLPIYVKIFTSLSIVPDRLTSQIIKSGGQS